MIYDTIKKFIKGSYLLSLTLLAFSNNITARSISGALSSELSKPPVVKPAAPSTVGGQAPSAAVSDEYVQSEAHMQLDEVREKMAHFNMGAPGAAQPLTPNQMVTPYLNLIANVLNKEVEFKNTHYVFYNASNSEWRVPQDLYKKLYVHYKKPGSQLDDFAFMRFGGAKSIKAEDFLNENIAKWGGVNDNIAAVKDVVMSVNLALFGNVGFTGECTWNYFLRTKSHRWPSAINYYEILKAFDVTYDIEALAKETEALSDMLIKASEEQALFQFFVPQKIVDDVAYLSWVLGFPAHPKSMALMEELMEGKPRIGEFTGPAVKNVMRRFKKDKENEIYKELAEHAAEGRFGISGFMSTFRNDPFAMKNVNETQGRLLVTNDAFKNPASGVKVFTHFTTPKNIQDDYMRKLDALIQKIISQENAKTPQQKTADRTKNEETFKRLETERKAREAEEAAKAKAEKAAARKK